MSRNFSLMFPLVLLLILGPVVGKESRVGSPGSAPRSRVVAEHIVDFRDSNTGVGSPVSEMTVSEDGAVYGAGPERSTFFSIVVWKYSVSDGYRILWSEQTAGYLNPLYGVQAIVSGPDGNIYVAAYFGGTYGRGGILKITPSGVATIAVEFTPVAWGVRSLTSDGRRYLYGGTDQYNDSFAAGTLFRFDTQTGSLETIAIGGAFRYVTYSRATDSLLYIGGNSAINPCSNINEGKDEWYMNYSIKRRASYLVSCGGPSLRNLTFFGVSSAGWVLGYEGDGGPGNSGGFDYIPQLGYTYEGYYGVSARTNPISHASGALLFPSEDNFIYSAKRVEGGLSIIPIYQWVEPIYRLATTPNGDVYANTGTELIRLRQVVGD